MSHKGGTNKPDPGPLNSDSKAPHNDLYENDINRWLVSNTNNYITLRQRGPKWKHIVWSSAIEVTLPGHPFNVRSSFSSLTPKKKNILLSMDNELLPLPQGTSPEKFTRESDASTPSLENAAPLWRSHRDSLGLNSSLAYEALPHLSLLKTHTDFNYKQSNG